MFPEGPQADPIFRSDGLPPAREHSKKYVLVTPAHNEESYIEKSIKAVISQTILPSEWIIVSDRSTDATDKIAEKYAAEYPFIRLIKLPPGEGRDFASKVIAFRSGYQALTAADYEYVGNLDADVSFAPDYYESVIRRFEEEERLGIAGGVILELIGGSFRKQISGLHSIAGAVQLFRRECFEQIGGFVPIRFGGEDSVAEVMARMKGWDVRAFNELEVYHHRRVSGSAGLLKARFRCGIMHYQIGYHPAFQLASTVYRLSERPFVIGSLLTLVGYGWASIRRVERPLSEAFVRYTAAEQLSRLRIRALVPEAFQKNKTDDVRREGAVDF